MLNSMTFSSSSNQNYFKHFIILREMLQISSHLDRYIFYITLWPSHLGVAGCDRVAPVPAPFPDPFPAPAPAPAPGAIRPFCRCRQPGTTHRADITGTGTGRSPALREQAGRRGGEDQTDSTGTGTGRVGHRHSGNGRDAGEGRTRPTTAG